MGLASMVWLCFVVLLCCHMCFASGASLPTASSPDIAGYRDDYADTPLAPLQNDKASAFSFGRFQSPAAVRAALDNVRAGGWTPHRGKDGRHGRVACTKLGGDWVLAESEQTAVQCTPPDVWAAFLSGSLQAQWNCDTVLDCRIRPIGGGRWRQDLVLRSQRILARCTGVMRYSQSNTVDQVGNQGHYCVAVRLAPDDDDDDDASSSFTTTTRKPFDALQVYISLRPTSDGQHVDIYAAGLMKVNRRVVPKFFVLDASGIAGTMAGRGTLWLAAHFAQVAARPRVSR
jgi:hypothetical protein